MDTKGGDMIDDDFMREIDIEHAQRLWECEFCGRDDGEHKCYECDEEFTEKECEHNEGLCPDCTYLLDK
jgi:hypothetical protein